MCSYNNKNRIIDAIIIKQLSDEDMVLAEIRMERATIIIVTMYFDINRMVAIDMQILQTNVTQAK